MVVYKVSNIRNILFGTYQCQRFEMSQKFIKWFILTLDSWEKRCYTIDRTTDFSVKQIQNEINLFAVA